MSVTVPKISLSYDMQLNSLKNLLFILYSVFSIVGSVNKSAGRARWLKLLLFWNREKETGPERSSASSAVSLSAQRWAHTGTGCGRADIVREEALRSVHHRWFNSVFVMFKITAMVPNVCDWFHREDVDRYDCGGRIWDQGGGTVVRQARPWTWYNFLSVFVSEASKKNNLKSAVK